MYVTTGCRRTEKWASAAATIRHCRHRQPDALDVPAVERPSAFGAASVAEIAEHQRLTALTARDSQITRAVGPVQQSRAATPHWNGHFVVCALGTGRRLHEGVRASRCFDDWSAQFSSSESLILSVCLYVRLSMIGYNIFLRCFCWYIGRPLYTILGVLMPKVCQSQRC